MRRSTSAQLQTLTEATQLATLKTFFLPACAHARLIWALVCLLRHSRGAKTCSLAFRKNTSHVGNIHILLDVIDHFCSALRTKGQPQSIYNFLLSECV